MELDDDDVDEDEGKMILAETSQSEQKIQKYPQFSSHQPIDEITLDRMRQARKEEIEMRAIVKEIVGYAFFILIIYFISYGNRHPMSYNLKSQIEQAFIIDPGFNNIITSNDWWEWVQKVAVPALRAQSYYNGVPAYELRGYIGDKTNRIMGYGVIRQVRVIPNICRVDKRVQNITQECAQVS